MIVRIGGKLKIFRNGLFRMKDSVCLKGCFWVVKNHSIPTTKDPFQEFLRLFLGGP